MLSTLTDEYSSIASNQLISKLFKHSKCQSRKKNALNMLHVSIKKKKNMNFVQQQNVLRASKSAYNSYYLRLFFFTVQT